MKFTIWPFAFLGQARQHAVGIDRDRMADCFHHRDVGGRVAVRVRRGQVDVHLLGERGHGDGLERPRAVEVDEARVAAFVVDPRPGAERPVDAEELAEWRDDLLG